MRNYRAQMLFLLALTSTNNCFATHRAPQTEEEEEAQFQEALRRSQEEKEDKQLQEAIRRSQQPQASHTTMPPSPRKKSPTRYTNPSFTKNEEKAKPTEIIQLPLPPTTTRTTSSSSATATAESAPTKKQTYNIQLHRFPTNAHAPRDINLEKDGLDITTRDVIFKFEEIYLGNIHALFDGSTVLGTYQERAVIGGIISSTDQKMPPASESDDPNNDYTYPKIYFWEQLTASPENVKTLTRFMLLNAKAIFYRDLCSAVTAYLGDEAFENPISINNNIFSEELINHITLLYQVHTTQEFNNNCPRVLAFLRNNKLLPKGDMNYAKITTMINSFVALLLKTVEEAIERGNSLLKKHGLTEV